MQLDVQWPWEASSIQSNTGNMLDHRISRIWRWAGQKRQCHIWVDEDQFTKHFSVQEGTRVLAHTHTTPKCMPAERGQILENSRRTLEAPVAEGNERLI